MQRSELTVVVTDGDASVEKQQRSWQSASEGSALELLSEPSPMPRAMVAYWTDALGGFNRQQAQQATAPGVLVAAVAIVAAMVMLIGGLAL